MMVNCQFLLENVVKWFIYIYTVLSFKFDQKEWNTTCSEPTTFIQHEDFSNSFSSTYIDTFLFTMGTKQKSIQMLHFYIAVLVTAAPLSWIFFWNLQAQVSQLLGPGLCFFASFQIRVFPLETCFTFTGWIRIPYTCWNASFFYSPPAGAS